MGRDVFISYRRNNGEDLSKMLKEKIERDIYTCFVDTEDLSTGYYKNHIMENIRECKLMVIIVTEGYLEKCCEKDDICLQEISMAIESNKEISIVTDIERSKIREILNKDYVPEILKNLKEVNMLYVTEDYIDETTEKLLKSLQEVDRKIFIKNNIEINKYDEDRSIKEISNKIFEIGDEFYAYDGEIVNEKLLGKGKLRGLSNVISIEGNFNCRIDSIHGDFKIYEKGNLVFVGNVEEMKSIKDLKEMKSIKDLKLTGSGRLNREDYIIEGRLIEGKLSGYAEVWNRKNNITYKGTFKDGKKHGEGTLVLEDNDMHLRCRTSFYNDEISEDLFIEDMKNNIEYTICKKDLDKLKDYNNSNLDKEELANYSSIYIEFKESSWGKFDVEIDNILKEKLKNLFIEFGMINFENKNILSMIKIRQEILGVVRIDENNILEVGLSSMPIDTAFLRRIEYNTENSIKGFQIENGYIKNSNNNLMEDIEIGKDEAKLLFNAESKKYIVPDKEKEKIKEIHKAMGIMAKLNYLLDKDIRKIIIKLRDEFKIIN